MIRRARCWHPGCVFPDPVVRHVRILTLALVMAAVGCSYHVYSPPARSLPLESPRPLPAGQTSVTGEAAAHALLFGPDLVGGGLKVTHGIAQGEVSLEGAALVVQGESAAGTNPVVGMGRAGFHAGDRIFGFAAGLGGGWSAAGPYVSPDFALIAGYENCYLVPFGALRASVSVPIDPRTVDVSKPEDGLGAHRLRPRTTAAFSPGVGLKVPLFHQCGEAVQYRAALLLGLAWTILVDADKSDTFFGLGGGLTVNF
jgi:hypothetical protein